MSRSSSTPWACHAIQWERMIEGILYALTELLLLWGLVAHISYWPATLHGPLLKSSKRPVDAMLHNAEVEHHGAVGWVLLRVVYQFEHDGPGLWDGNEGKTLLAEDGLWHSILVLGQGIENQIVCVSLLAAIR